MHWVCPLMLSSLLETLSYGIPFVKNVDPTGQFLNDSERVPCQVIAVIEDLPQNSHFNFEYLESMTPDVADYDGLEFFIYLKFREGVHLEKAVEKSNRVNRKVLEGDNTLKYTNRE